MLAFTGCSYGEVLVRQRGVSADGVIQYTPRGNDFARQFPASQLAFETAKVDNSEIAWIEGVVLTSVSNRQ